MDLSRGKKMTRVAPFPTDQLSRKGAASDLTDHLFFILFQVLLLLLAFLVVLGSGEMRALKYNLKYLFFSFLTMIFFNICAFSPPYSGCSCYIFTLL